MDKQSLIEEWGESATKAECMKRRRALLLDEKRRYFLVGRDVDAENGRMSSTYT